jgi:two-component system, cell cycle sensor histidine kinase and response regulator CckA
MECNGEISIDREGGVETGSIGSQERSGASAGAELDFRDIAGRKKADKTLQFSEEALRQSKKMEAMGKLSGGIAHDFNNMLTAINGYAGMALSMAEPQSELHGYLTQVMKAGDRATELIKQLLAFSRQQTLAPRILEPNTIVYDMHVMLSRLIGESVGLRLDLDPNLGHIKADTVQIQQILMNLVINARDAMPRGGEITIMTRNADLDRAYAILHPEAGDYDYVLLSVRDTGVGMDADVEARAFDPFFTTKEIGKGTGMGLATVKDIVEKSGGHITVESVLGKGSTFRIFLPRRDQEAVEPAIPTIVDAAGEQGAETVLLAEDDPIVREFIRKALERYGYKVLEAANGAMAMELIGAHGSPIDLLLTDLMMPDLNGWEVARNFLRMRTEGRVLFMSGYSEDSVARRDLIEAGGRFIQKPFTTPQLAAMIRDVLKKESHN